MGKQRNPESSPDNLFTQIAVQEGQELSDALAIAFATSQEPDQVPAVLRAFNRLQRRGVYSPTGEKYRDLTSYLQGYWFRDGWEDTASWRELNDEAHEYLDALKRNPKRVANTHDPRRSAREFRAALDRANENIAEGSEAGMRGGLEAMLSHFLAAAVWIGRAGAELKYAGADEVDRDRLEQYQELAAGVRTWGDTISQYMRDEMGIAANPARKRTTTSKAACTVGASAHKSRSAAARQCGTTWKASAKKFASTGGKAAARKRRRSR